MINNYNWVGLYIKVELVIIFWLKKTKNWRIWPSSISTMSLKWFQNVTGDTCELFKIYFK